MPADPLPPTVTVTPAGPLFMDAAAWVGAASWAELQLHRALTDLLRTAEPDQALVLWAVRARRAELAAAWHQRLPELRELPRSGFVEPTADVSEILAPLEAATSGGSAGGESISVVAGVLAELAAHYRAQESSVVGPADGPTAATLRRAVADTDADLETLDSLRSP